jgi:hypothetical protein
MAGGECNCVGHNMLVFALRVVQRSKEHRRKKLYPSSFLEVTKTLRTK